MNRERAVARNILPSIIAQLKFHPWLAVCALYNVIVDYCMINCFGICGLPEAHGYADPAEDAARKHGVCPALLSLLAGYQSEQEDTSGYVPNICSLLDIIVVGDCKS